MSAHHHMSAHNQKTLQSYIIGFALCMLLTVTAFGIVMLQLLSAQSLYIALAILSIAQLTVQCVCFLRLNASAPGRWNLLPFLFTLLIILIFVSGSLWIMYHLNYNMTH